MDAPPLVVVTGPPGAGKTTVARDLAERLGLPLLAKDTIKEALFDSLGIGDDEWSNRLGRATFAAMFALLRELLELGTGAVVEANFVRGESEPRFVALPPARLVQLYCASPPELLVERYQKRKRHPGHRDAERVHDVRRAIASERHGPLDLAAELIELDTTLRVDLDGLERRIRALL